MKIGAITGGLFGGYQKLLDKVYTGNPEIDAKLDNAAKNYSDFMRDAYRLTNDPVLKGIAERRIDDTAIPAAAESGKPETMNFGNVLREKPGTVSAEQKTLLQTDVLLSAFADENGIVPVRLTVKEFKDKDNSLYALITLEKIETEIFERGESSMTTPTSYPVSEMSIPDIVSKIKPTDGNILKYLPDKLLSAEQLEGKRAKR